MKNPHDKRLQNISWHPLAQNLLLTTAVDKLVKVWDVEHGAAECMTLPAHDGFVTSFTWNFDGTLLATTSRDKMLRVIDPRSNTIVSVFFLSLFLLPVQPCPLRFQPTFPLHSKLFVTKVPRPPGLFGLARGTRLSPSASSRASQRGKSVSPPLPLHFRFLLLLLLPRAYIVVLSLWDE